MFRLTKVKVAAAIAAGAVALGAAGAYAANTVPGPLTSAPKVNGQTLWRLPGNTATVPTFDSFGDCVSWFASHKGFVLGGTQTQTVHKNYHGKLMSEVKTLCTKTKDTSSTETQTQEPQTETGGDTGTPPAWAHHGGHAGR